MNRLKQYRKAAGLTQEAVAVKLDVTQETVTSHEIGRRGISAAMLVQYARLYNCSLDDLLPIDEQPTESADTTEEASAS